MTKYSSKEWALIDLPQPVYVNKPLPNSSCDLILSAFQQNACRLHVAKTCTMILDAHFNMPAIGNLAAVCERLTKLDHAGLPATLQPALSLPHGCTVSYIINNNHDGTMDVLRILKVNAKEAQDLCTGRCLFPFFRPGPWAWTRAMHSLLNRLPGHHVVWWSLETKEAKKSTAPQWAPAEDELRKRVSFVNRNAPEDDTENQQYLWILTNIRPDSGSPIAGWPEGKVSRVVQNKSRGTASATSLSFFPFSVRSLKPFMGEFLLPLIGPLLTSYGILTIGWPGVGRTPFLIVLSLALGRYHIQRLNLEGVMSAWRRAKGIDNFRHKTGQIHEGLILDDGWMDRLDAADVKSWLTAEEDQNCSSRNTDVKLVRNGLRALSANDLADEDEPPHDPRRTSITITEFFKLSSRNSSPPTRKRISWQSSSAVWSWCLGSMPSISGCRARIRQLPFTAFTRKIFI